MQGALQSGGCFGYFGLFEGKIRLAIEGAGWASDEMNCIGYVVCRVTMCDCLWPLSALGADSQTDACPGCG